MSEFMVIFSIYIVLFLMGIVILPGGWKIAVLPVLLAMQPLINQGYMSDVFASIGMIYSSIYMITVLLLYGLFWLFLPKEDV